MEGAYRFAKACGRIQGHRLGKETFGCADDVVNGQRRRAIVVRWVARKLLVEEVLHGLLRSSGQKTVVLD